MSSTSQLTTFSDAKTCSKCRTEKSRALFSKRRGYGDQLSSWCKSCHSAYMANYDQTHKRAKLTSEELRRINYRKVHGITVEQYDSMLAAQAGRCAICASLSPGSNVNHFTVDHCHATGRIRGLLCRPCNMALGLMKDSATSLRSAAKYLEDAE